MQHSASCKVSIFLLYRFLSLSQARDGGLLNNVPANVLVAKGCNFVIASTVTAQLEKDFEGISSRLIGRFFSTIQVIMRQSIVQDYNMNSVGVQPADFVIAPDVTSFDMSEFTRADEMARVGETTTNENVAKLRKMLSRLDSKLFESSCAAVATSASSDTLVRTDSGPR